MISCTDFIPVYSELFRFLEAEGGRGAVTAFWEALSDDFLGNLRDLAARKGVEGCFEYWSQTLTEEAADFRMVYDPDRDELTIEMRDCPSKGRLLAETSLTPYPDYCEHCVWLYPRALAPLGLTCEGDLSECGRARCSFRVYRTGAESMPE